MNFHTWTSGSNEDGDKISYSSPKSRITQSYDQLDLLFTRRSIGRLNFPGPNADEMETIIKAGAAAPDHGRLTPWRFIVIEGDQRAKFGEILAEALRIRLAAQGIKASDAQIAKEQNKLLRAPVVTIVAVTVQPSNRIPVIEQILSGAAACENMLLAATALGFGSMWRTGDPNYDPYVKQALGFGENDHLIGWLYFGTSPENHAGRTSEVNVDPLITYWGQK